MRTLKKSLFLLLFVAMAFPYFADTYAANPKKVKKTPEQIFAEDKNRSSLRAWASFNGLHRQNLESLAAMNARANLAEQVSVLVSRSVEIYSRLGDISSISVKEGKDGEILLENGAKVNLSTYAKELLEGSVVVMSDRYKLKDGTEDCYVAVELRLENLLENTIGHAELNELLKGVDTGSDQFAEAMTKAFESLLKAQL